MDDITALPVAVIGAGPVGLAAAAHLVQRGLSPLVFEQGAAVGAAIRQWSHVRLFSPWQYTVDAAARTLLLAAGWDEPEATDLPTGGEIVSRYLEPLAHLPQIAPHLRLGARVTAVTRQGLDKVTTPGRSRRPFDLRWVDADGNEQSTLVRAVIDASGTWGQPNPMGIDGLPIPGEAAGARVHRLRHPRCARRRARAPMRARPCWSSAAATRPSMPRWLCWPSRTKRPAPGSSGRCAATASSACSAVGSTTSCRSAGPWALRRSGPSMRAGSKCWRRLPPAASLADEPGVVVEGKLGVASM